MTEPVCLTIEELRDYALGRSEPDRCDEILAHLEDCSVCEDTVGSLENTADSLLDHLRVGSGPIPAMAAVAIERAKRRIESEPAFQNANHEPPAHVRDYQLLEEVGAGGMGTVFRAVHTRLDKVVALKLLPAQRMRDGAAVARFEREMKAAGRLDHPSIVTATDAGQIDETHFLVMEYIDGLDLNRLQKAVGQLSIANACELIRQTAIGLQYAHERGMVHRDIKPSNIMLASNGRVKILDLGLALLADNRGATDNLTTVGQFMGTLDYMAPEQCDDSHEVDIRADLYSLGATLFRLLTGEVPFGGAKHKSVLAKIRALATEDAPALSSIREDVPAKLAQLTSRLLSKNPDARPASPLEVADELQEFVVGSDLQELVERGSAAASGNTRPVDASVLSVSLLKSPAPKRSQSEPPPAPVGSAAGKSILRNGFKWVVAATLAMAAGIVVWIQTDTGHLVIEADEAAFVRVVKGDDVVKSWKIIPGRNETTIRAGQYSIELDGQFDSLDVDGGEFKLTRGDKVIATVKRSAPPADVADNAQAKSPSDRRLSDRPDEKLLGYVYDFGGMDVTPRELYQRMTGELMSLQAKVEECARSLGTANPRIANTSIQMAHRNLMVLQAELRKVSEDLRANPLEQTAIHKRLKAERAKLQREVGEQQQRLAQSGEEVMKLDRLSRQVEFHEAKLKSFRDIVAPHSYKGKTWREWNQEAMRATGLLGSRPDTKLLNRSLVGMKFAAGGTRHTEAADFILTQLEDMYVGPKGPLSVWSDGQSLLSHLHELGPGAIEAIARRLRSGESHQRDVATLALQSGSQGSNLAAAIRKYPGAIAVARMHGDRQAKERLLRTGRVINAIGMLHPVSRAWLPTLRGKFDITDQRSPLIVSELARLASEDKDGVAELFKMLKDESDAFLLAESVKSLAAPIKRDYLKTIVEVAFSESASQPIRISEQHYTAAKDDDDISSVRIELFHSLNSMGPDASSALKQLENLAEELKVGVASHTSEQDPVSYTHLTLPTIYSV